MTPVRSRKANFIPPGLLAAENARNNLPVHLYLLMLDQAARTGYMPVIDEHGKIQKAQDGSPLAHELNGMQRKDIAVFLINKVLPDVPKETFVHMAHTKVDPNTPVEKLKHLSVEALRLIAENKVVDVDFEKSDESAQTT